MSFFPILVKGGRENILNTKMDNESEWYFAMTAPIGDIMDNRRVFDLTREPWWLIASEKMRPGNPGGQELSESEING